MFLFLILYEVLLLLKSPYVSILTIMVTNSNTLLCSINLFTSKLPENHNTNQKKLLNHSKNEKYILQINL